MGETHDVVFDAFGHLGYRAGKRVLSRAGAFVTTLALPPLMLLALAGRLVGGPRFVAANYRGKPEDYKELARLIAKQAVKPIIGATFDLANTAEAFAALEGGGTPGKVVVRVP